MKNQLVIYNKQRTSRNAHVCDLFFLRKCGLLSLMMSSVWEGIVFFTFAGTIFIQIFFKKSLVCCKLCPIVRPSGKISCIGNVGAIFDIATVVTNGITLAGMVNPRLFRRRHDKSAYMNKDNR